MPETTTPHPIAPQKEQFGEDVESMITRAVRVHDRAVVRVHVCAMILFVIACLVIVL